MDNGLLNLVRQRIDEAPAYVQNSRNDTSRVKRVLKDLPMNNYIEVHKDKLEVMK